MPEEPSTAPMNLEALRSQATRCRRLALSVTDQRTVDALMSMASEYEAQAQALEGSRRTPA